MTASFSLAGQDLAALEGRAFKAAIFDFDGTLAASMWVWKDIDRLFCQRHGLTLPEGYEEDLLGLGFEGAAQYFIDKLGCTLSLQQCCESFNDLAYDRYAQDVRLLPGAADFLRELNRRGIPCAIASSLNRRLLTAALKGNGVQDAFQVICLCDEHNTHKSVPFIYQQAARELGVHPQDCVVFEDIVPGIASAQAAGMAAVAVVDEGNEAQDTPQVRSLAHGCIAHYQGILG